MIGQTRLVTALSGLVRRTRADAVSVSAHAKLRRVLRFAYGRIHQNLTQERIDVSVKVIEGKQSGVASTDSIEPELLTRCAQGAQAIARHSPEQVPIPTVPMKHKVRSKHTTRSTFSSRGSTEWVKQIKHLFHIAEGTGAQLAGSLMTGEDVFVVVNSAGVRCVATRAVCAAKLITLYGPLSGYASVVHQEPSRLDLEALLERSLKQSLHDQEPVALPLGMYEVILEPEAVAELLTWMGYTAFGAKSVQERTSALAGRMGEQIVDPQVTITDDGNDPEGLPMLFDFEGTPKQRVDLIANGIATGIVYDTAYGARFGHSSTGHAMPPEDVDGPLPLNLFFAPGRTSLAAMIRSCRRGLLIPRLHYVNGLLNPPEALMTGLTREGTFLIEEGKITRAARTMRFTQSMLEALRNIKGISKERRLIAEPSQELGCAVVPSLHLGEFRFTGRSQ